MTIKKCKTFLSGYEMKLFKYIASFLILLGLLYIPGEGASLMEVADGFSIKINSSRYHGYTSTLINKKRDNLVPLANLSLLIKEQNWDQFNQSLNAAFVIGTFGSGVLAQGGNVARVEGLFTALSAGALAVDDYKHELRQSEAGRDFLAAWENFHAVFAIWQAGKIIVALPESYKSLKEAYKQLKTKNSSTASKLSKEVDELIAKGDEVIEGLSKGGDELADINKLKNIKAVTPTGKNLTNLKKAEFVQNGYKVKPLNGRLKTKIDDIIENGDNLGLKTEGIVDDIMGQNAYKKLDGKYGSNNGYDGVYIKVSIENPSEIIIVESKQFKYTNGVADEIVEHTGVSLNPPSGTTPLPAQMSDGWVEYVADKLILNPKTQQLGDKIKQLIQFDKSKITKYVTAVDKTQGEINFLKLDTY